MKINKIAGLCIIMIFTISFVVANNYRTNIEENYSSHPVDIVVFHKEGCPACARLLSYLDELNYTYSGMLNIYEYEIHEEGVLEIANDLAKRYETKLEKVPTVFINDKVFVGYSSEIANDIKLEIDYCLQSGKCISPFEKESKNLKNNKNVNSQELSITAFVLVAILLATILAVIKKRKP